MTGDEARFVAEFRRCADHYGGIMIDGSRMIGTGSYEQHFEAVADGVRQVPFFRITDKGRAWIAEVPQ